MKIKQEFNSELVDFIASELEKRLNQLARNSEATDLELQLALKNVVSKKENEIAMKMQAAALFSALNKIGA
ncbi:hypothetical protein BBM68_05310 [Vibrio parahaemolyticus]|uniref:hypothetical protein n=1 Tax=Vibrio parahaemolyticus TaxID=670 RepID=UPI00084AFCA1|nr:hypothetical protein [Vibrio parahaemolyticus]OEA64476.1 hypothetical protein BBM67_24120 [Vibrio parahaemolyticus]OEA77927.1 hypothetical protein BBM68_05310 [Vibrio parahaemolyticus]